MKIQNIRLEKTVSVLSEDQRSRFSSLFEEQKRVGAETAKQINGSANLLNRSIDDSIRILKKSSKEIDRAVYPIKELRISWVLTNPLKTTTGDAYRKRILKSISELTKHPDGLLAMGELYGSNEIFAQGITITKAPYTPDMKNELAVYNTMSRTFLSIEFYKKNVTINALINKSSKPDLRMNVGGDIGNSFNDKSSSYDLFSSHVRLSYEFNRNDFVVSAGFLAPTYLHNITGNIVSIPDFNGSTMVIRVGGGFHGVYDKNIDTRSINEEIKHINNSSKILGFAMRMSEGRKFEIKGSQLTQYTDSNRDTFFVYKFPSDL